MGRFDEWLDDTRPVTVAPVTGIGDTIGMLMSHGNISPYIMAWLITVLIRLATGQGVVSAMTAAGIISAAILDRQPVNWWASTRRCWCWQQRPAPTP